jgi:hypothetical protein
MNTAPIRVRAVRAGRTLIAPSRLLLAGKTAAAAALAWWLAPFVPFAAAEYSYYAPLGVVVSMYPTLVDSARSGLQTVVGLATGIGLGLGAVGLTAAGIPAFIGLAAVVAIGTLLAGVQILGPGREWITLAAMFVLLIGGRSDPDGYSFSYLLTMAFGIVVGVVVNLVIAPPVSLRFADQRMSDLRDSLAASLGGMADAVAADGIDQETLDASIAQLSADLSDVADQVHDAARSRRGNPRGRGREADERRNADRLRAIERATFFTRDLAEALSRLPARDPALRGDGRRMLGAAIRACRDLVAAEPGADDEWSRYEVAEGAVDDYLAALDIAADTVAGVAEQATAGVSLRRIVDACRPLS